LKPKPKQEPKPARLSPGLSRVITGAIALPILIASIVVPQLRWLFVGVVAVAMIAGLFEFWKLALKQQVRSHREIGLLAAAGLFTVFLFIQPGELPDLFKMQIILILLTIFSLTAAMLRGAPFDKMIMSVGSTLLGVMYVVLLGGHLVALRVGFEPQLSKHLLSFFFLVLMGADAAAYYGGRAFGRRKLAPKISPGKTWEGAIAGMLASLGLAAAAHYWFFRDLPLKLALPLAAVMNVLSVIGDLTESALKRSAGAKDAGNLLRGHGGALDRMDSLLFNAPVIYYFARVYFVH